MFLQAKLDKLESIIGGKKEILVHQKVSFMEAATQGCCEKKNVYGIFTNHAQNSKTPDMVAYEESECMDRTCCDPYHTLKVNIMASNEILMTLERPGCTFMFCSAPKPFLCCPAYADSCSEEVSIHLGDAVGPVGEIPDTNVFMTGKQRTCCEPGAMFHPVIDFKRKHSQSPDFTVTGPFIFGGCSELCCSSRFTASSGKGQNIGSMKKLAPSGCVECCTEMCTDSDRYKIEYMDYTTGPDRAALIAAAFLADYMFFEQDNGMISCKDNAVSCTFFQCYCFGGISNCSLTVRQSENN